MDRKELGKRLRAIRKQKGLSQSQLADLMGYKDHSTLAKVETGVNDITIETLYKYGSVLGVDVIDILQDKFK
jgi:transcriptional regulator with XRE-family HTH domain